MKKTLTSGLVAGLAMLLLIAILTPVYNLIFPGISQEYMNVSLFRPWSDPLMSLYYLYPFLLGLVLAWFWGKAKKMFSGKSNLEKAKEFAVFYWLIAGLPGMFITYSSFQVSLSLILAWSISGFVDAFIAAWIFVKRGV